MNGRGLGLMMVVGGVMATVRALLRRRPASPDDGPGEPTHVNDPATDQPPVAPTPRPVAEIGGVTGPGGPVPPRTPSTVVLSEPDPTSPLGPDLEAAATLGRITQDIQGLPPPPQHRRNRSSSQRAAAHPPSVVGPSADPRPPAALPPSVEPGLAANPAPPSPPSAPDDGPLRPPRAPVGQVVPSPSGVGDPFTDTTDLDLDAVARSAGSSAADIDHVTATTTTGAGPETATTGVAVDDPTRGGIFYGWFLVAAVFVILVVSSGLGFYNASVILAAAIDELDAPVGAVSGATGLFFAISGLTGFAFSKRLDSADIRWFYLTGGIVGAVALLGLRLVTNIVSLYVFFALFGVGFALAGLVPSTTLVTRWFERRRSVALSIASTGLSMGGIVVTPIAAWLIDRRDLAGAAPWLAAFWIIGIVPIALLVLRSRPSDRGLLPDGELTEAPIPTPSGETEAPGPRPGPTPEPDARGVDFTTARRTRFFIALCFAYAVVFFGQVGAIAQLFNMVRERTDVATASTCLSVLALTSVVARLVGGAVVIRVPTKPFTAALAIVQGVGLVLLALATSSTSLILSAAVFGISIGNLLMLQPLLLAEAFGVVNYGRIYSFNQLFGTIGVAGGPLALGILHDLFDYEVAFLVAAAASVAGFVFIVLAGSTARVQQLWT